MSYLCNVERGQKTQVLRQKPPSPLKGSVKAPKPKAPKPKAPKPPKGECKEEGK